jgi:hypothetical protein
MKLLFAPVVELTISPRQKKVPFRMMNDPLVPATTAVAARAVGGSAASSPQSI